MGRKANPGLIGAFVVGALVLAVIAVMVLGSGKFFREREEFVLLFDGSVNGLEKGAPVKFRGVPIGAVTRIVLRLEQERSEEGGPAIPVFIEIDTGYITTTLGAVVDLADPEVLHALIYEGGLRGQLQTQSLITGVLYVSLDVFPDTPIVMRLPEGGPYREIPTLPTTLETLFKDLKAILAKINETDLEGLVAKARDLFASGHDLLASAEVKNALAAADKALVSVDRLAQNLDAEIKPLASSLRLTLDGARGGLSEGEQALKSVAELLQPDSPLVLKIERALAELASAGRAVAVLADYLDRNPNALLVGRPPPGGDRR